MRTANRFAIAVHIVTLLGVYGEEDLTSEWMANSIGVNPVVVRNVTGLLRRAGLVRSRQGIAGTHLTRPVAQITLLDLYHAVEQERELFSIHQRPNPECPVGAGIQSALEAAFGDARDAMEARLGLITLDRIARVLAGAEGQQPGSLAVGGQDAIVAVITMPVSP